MPMERLAYMHVAGGIEYEGLYHDTHAAPVNPEVLHLISQLREHVAIPAAMVERDGDYPPEPEIVAELGAIADAARLTRVY